MVIILLSCSQLNILQKSNILLNTKNNAKIETVKENSEIQKLYACYLQEGDFVKTMTLSRQERKSLGLPPNKYFEQEWQATIDPIIGRPTPEKVHLLRQTLEIQRENQLAMGRVPGDASDNAWVERGPDNVGGRTRAILFDPNDASNETVIAGGVSGGLWKNTNISNANSTWVKVNMPENLNVTCLSVDPNNSNIFYAGTGESYVGGDVNGDGLWKSTDGGSNWSKIFGGVTGNTFFQSSSNITINSPSAISGTISSIETTAYGPAITSSITSNIVLVSDGTAEASLGCNALTNATNLAGKIALIRRGTCTFVQKIVNAKNAGAIAVIVMNNVSGIPAAMGGTDTNNEINIPSVAISKVDGDILENALLNGNVNVTLNPASSSIISANFVPGIQHINDVEVRNNGGVSEIYVAVADVYTYGASLGGQNYGLYKSVNGGTSWTQINLPLTPAGHILTPNDIEFSGNTIWVTTTGSTLYGDGGGKVFKSTDGVNFTEVYSVLNGDRTQIAVSKVNPNKAYILAQIDSGVTIVKTADAFVTTTILPLPVDIDSGIPATDFTRGQAFYDLIIKLDPTNDENVFIGGINLFKSLNGGTSWTQLSNWYPGSGVQEVHADQHAIVFGNGNGGQVKMMFGNDGGVYYSSNSGSTISVRNKGYNVTQFYSVGVAPTNSVSGLTGDYFVAGAQDNGSQYFVNAPQLPVSSTEVQGGDGAFSMFDQGADKYYITNYVYNANINLRFTSGSVRNINSESLSFTNGAFIAPMVLDSNRDALYSDYSSGTTYTIRRYTNIKSGTVTKTALTNALLTGRPTAFAVSKYTTTSTKLLVGTNNGKVLRLLNANTTPTWADLSISTFVGTVSDIEYGANELEIFVTFQNYNVTSVWYTNDGGSTWLNKEGNLPDIPVKCILQNPLNLEEVIVGTELGVWRTGNFSADYPTWTQSYNGMRNVKVTDLDLRDDNMVYAATYGRGIFSGQFTAATALSNNPFITQNKLAIYPNPASEIINIDMVDYQGELQLQLIDINGRIVLENKIKEFSGHETLSITNLVKGVYFLRLINRDNLNHTQKIIIK